MSFFILIIGLTLLIMGGEFLVRASVALAKLAHVPPLLIGLTIVALGTSAPEMMVAIKASLNGAPDLITGGVIGSNIANILLILGVTALIAPIATQLRMINRDGLFLVGVSAFIAALALTGIIGRIAGIGMILVYVFYMAYSYWSERIASAGNPEDMQEQNTPGLKTEDLGAAPKRLFIALPMFVFGLGGILWGADLVVSASVEIARAFGISEAVIGLSIVALGTSLPELAASIIAALRRQPEMALGNVVGSNITNILLVLGLSGTIAPVPIAVQIANFDVWVMLGITMILVPVLVSGQRLSRIEALFFLMLYGVYIAGLYAGWPAKIIGYFTVN